MSKQETSKSLPVLKYVSQVQTELKKVTWPTKEDTTNMTIMVIATSTIVALYLGGLDFLFTNLINRFFI